MVLLATILYERLELVRTSCQRKGGISLHLSSRNVKQQIVVEGTTRGRFHDKSFTGFSGRYKVGTIPWKLRDRSGAPRDVETA